MIAHQTLASLWPTAPLLATAGFVLGMAYFASLRRGVLLAVERHAWLGYLLSALIRIAAAALFFTFAVRWGAPALLAAFGGFLAARYLAVRAARRPA
jgi:F1F0 ATPase subunit 2